MKLNSNGILLVWPTNIRLGWELMEVANTLAQYNMATITAVKRFKGQTPGHTAKVSTITGTNKERDERLDRVFNFKLDRFITKYYRCIAYIDDQFQS